MVNREKIAMPVETTYTRLKQRLDSALAQVANDQEVIIVRRRGASDVALVPAEELSSLPQAFTPPKVGISSWRPPAE